MLGCMTNTTRPKIEFVNQRPKRTRLPPEEIARMQAIVRRIEFAERSRKTKD